MVSDFRGTGAKPTDLGHTNTSGFPTADRRFTGVFIMRYLAGLMDSAPCSVYCGKAL
jgi:hypothetical protein